METHEPPPHDDDAHEPLGPFTPDDASEAGDTPEVHDAISPHDIPKSNPGRPEAVREAGGEDGETIGNVGSPLTDEEAD